jgi:hypothetical protein
MHGLSSSSCPHIPFFVFLSLSSLSPGGSSGYVSSVYTCCHPQCLTHCARVNRVPMNSTLHLTSWRRQLQSNAASRPLPPKSLQAPSTVVLPQSSFLSFVAMFRHLDLRLGCQSVPFFARRYGPNSMRKGKFARSAKAVAQTAQDSRSIPPPVSSKFQPHTIFADVVHLLDDI